MSGSTHGDNRKYKKLVLGSAEFPQSATKTNYIVHKNQEVQTVTRGSKFNSKNKYRF
jgi:hypothetical protein